MIRHICEEDGEIVGKAVESLALRVLRVKVNLSTSLKRPIATHAMSLSTNCFVGQILMVAERHHGFLLHKESCIHKSLSLWRGPSLGRSKPVRFCFERSSRVTLAYSVVLFEKTHRLGLRWLLANIQSVPQD